MANDTVNVQRGIVGAGADDDTYVLSANLIDDNAQITISDVEGSNSIQLIGGLTISSSIVAGDTAQLTLSNGAVVTVLGASTMSYVVGGNPLAGVDGVTKDYTAFVADVLGTTVPAEGEANSSGGESTVNEDGTATGGDPNAPTYTLTAGAESVDEGATATFTLATTNVAEGTEVAYTISGVDAADVDGGSLTGTATVAADGTATISVALASDGATEGAETLNVAIDGQSASASTTVNDTSTSASFTLTSDVTSVVEGNAVTFTVTASSAVVADTTFKYQVSGVEIAGGTAELSDFTVGSGTLTMPAGATTATFQITPSDDGIAEGFEGFKATILDSNFVEVASSDNVVIEDGAEAGKVFSLTTAANLLNPTSTTAADKTTSGNDVIYATTNNSLDAADIIDTGDGTDSITATIANVSIKPLVSNLETATITMNVKSDDDTSTDTSENTTLDIGSWTGLTSLTISGEDSVKATFNGTADGTGDIIVKGMTSLDGLPITLKSIVGGKTTGQDATVNTALDFAYAAATGAADNVSLTLDGVSNTDVLVRVLDGTEATGDQEGVEMLTLTTENNASTVDGIFTYEDDGSTNALEDLVIKGDKDLTIADAVSFVTDSATATLKEATVDASAFTGKLSATFDVADDDDSITVTSGTANDTLTITSSGTDNTSGSAVVTVTSGAGNDTIDVQDIADRVDDTSTASTNESQIKNVTIDAGEGNDTIKVNAGNLSINAGAGDDTLEVASGVLSQITQYDAIDLGEGTADTVKTDEATIDSTDNGNLKYVTNGEIVSMTATGDKVIDLTALTTFSSVEIAAHTTQAVAGSGSAGTDGADGVDFTVDNSNNTIIISADVAGETGQEAIGSADSEDGGAGGIGLDINAKLDNGSNAVTIKLMDDADIAGGVGGAASGDGTDSGDGGNGGNAIDANEFESVNIILAATDTTADAVAFTGGAGGASGGDASSDVGTTSDVGIVVGNNATITVTQELTSKATDTTKHASSIDFNTITGTNVTVNASAVTNTVKIGAVSGNTVLTTGSGDDEVLAGSGVDTISTGAGNDVINAQAGADIIDVGTGRDVVTIDTTSTDGSMATESSATAFDTITNFGLLGQTITAADLSTTVKFQAYAANGEADLLDFTDTASTTTVAVTADVTSAASVTVNAATVKYTIADGLITITENASKIETDAHAIAVLEHAVGGDVTDGLTAAVVANGNTYVMSNNSDANEDMDAVVKLTGLTGVTGLEVADASVTEDAGTLFIA